MPTLRGRNIGQLADACDGSRATLVLLLSSVSMSTSGQVDVAVLATDLSADIFIDAVL